MVTMMLVTISLRVTLESEKCLPYPFLVLVIPQGPWSLLKEVLKFAFPMSLDEAVASRKAVGLIVKIDSQVVRQGEERRGTCAPHVGLDLGPDIDLRINVIDN